MTLDLGGWKQGYFSLWSVKNQEIQNNHQKTPIVGGDQLEDMTAD